LPQQLLLLYLPQPLPQLLQQICLLKLFLQQPLQQYQMQSFLQQPLLQQLVPQYMLPHKQAQVLALVQMGLLVQEQVVLKSLPKLMQLKLQMLQQHLKL
jgi:hypothetical protein